MNKRLFATGLAAALCMNFAFACPGEGGKHAEYKHDKHAKQCAEGQCPHHSKKQDIVAALGLEGDKAAAVKKIQEAYKAEKKALKESQQEQAKTLREAQESELATVLSSEEMSKLKEMEMSKHKHDTKNCAGHKKTHPLES